MFQVDFRPGKDGKVTVGKFTRILKSLISTKTLILDEIGKFLGQGTLPRVFLGKMDFMGLITLDNNLKNIYDLGYSPNEKQLGIQKFRFPHTLFQLSYFRFSSRAFNLVMLALLP